MKGMILRAGCLIALFTMTGCAALWPPEPEARDYEAERAVRDELWSRPPAPLRMTPEPEAAPVADPDPENLYTFVANELPVAQACRLFGKAYNLNMVVEPDVSGTVSVDLQDLPFAEVMESLLGANGYFWERRGNIVYVRSWETRIFTIDYIRLVRSGQGSSMAQVSSSAQVGGAGGAAGGLGGGGAIGGGGGAVGGGADGGAAGAISIMQSDSVDFWVELEGQLEKLVSEDGRLVINRLAGTVQVTDAHPRVEEIASFIEQLNQAIYRQVDIEVKIVEVELNNDEALGVDWSRLVRDGDGEFLDGSLSTIIVSPAGGLDALSGTANLTFSDIDGGLNRITAVVEALQEQGKVDIVSQPHIRTLNNQSALIKVGTDRTFFRREQSTGTTAAGAQTFATDVPQVVTEGIVLSITPQVSKAGWITLDVSPVVTRVSSVSEVLDDNGVVQSTAPNLDISQTSSLVRARSGETIVIGGLIQSQETEARRSVPVLSRIPLLGRLFRSNYTIETRKELILMVTPRLIST